METLTNCQEETLRFISAYISSHSYPPTMREIASAFGISVKGARDRCLILEKKGVLKRAAYANRTMEVCRERETPPLRDIPLVGTIAAGTPILSEENFESTLSLPEAFFKSASRYFALRVSGDSMIGAGIFDGDLAILEQCETAENGSIVAAVANDAITLKRFYRENHRIRLQSENGAYKPMYYQDVRVVGKLTLIFRKY